VRPGGSVTASLVDQTGIKLTAADGSGLVILNVEFLSMSRFAPYQGWDEYRTRATGIWDDWKSAIGYRKISRVGVRYVNRIDIPATSTQLPIKDYLTVFPSVPAGLPAPTGFATQIVGPLAELQAGDGRFQLVATTAVIPSPLVNHLGFVVDIDISRDQTGGAPQKDADLWSLIDRMRIYKNDVFERCITDRARALFS
jgi:uncharacterized protein (TIGR04255 family)